MTATNATACDEYLHEIELLVKDQPRDEAYEMVEGMIEGCKRVMMDIASIPELDPTESAHEAEIAAADDRHKVRRENQ